MEPLSAAVRPDIRPAGMGACTCPAGTMYAGCTCKWSVAIDRLMQLAYSRRADPVTIAREAAELGSFITKDVTTPARRAALLTIARDWSGSVNALARLLGISTQALRTAAPRAVAMITDRRGTTRFHR